MNKVWSTFISTYIGLSLITIGFFGFFIFDNSVNDISVTAASAWVQTSDEDFEEGTFDNVIIEDKGEDAKLIVDILEPDSWAKLVLSNEPLNRDCHSMSYIYNTDKVLLFGGLVLYPNMTSALLNDTWVFSYNKNTWVQKFPKNAQPSTRLTHAMASIHGTDKILLFGGSPNYYDSLNDTWIYSYKNNTWTQKFPPAPQPVSRYKHSMASIHGTNKVLLYGGELRNASGYIRLNDTWIYNINNNTWVKKTPAVSPSIGNNVMTSVYGTDKVVLVNYVGTMNMETWVYDLSDDIWTKTNPSSNPTYNYDNKFAAIHGTDKVLLYGSHSIPNPWIYDLNENTWTQNNTKTSPSSRYFSAVSSFYGIDKILLFGGRGQSPYMSLNDTWLYSYSKANDNGTFISMPYNTGSSSNMLSLNWNASIPKNTSINLQIRSAINKSVLMTEDFVGPNGNNQSYYTTSPSKIWSGHDGDQWIQLKIYFKMFGPTETPSLQNVTITYNCKPITELIKPGNRYTQNNSKPTFEWKIVDMDPGPPQQIAFQILIDNDENFGSVDFDSGIQASSDQHWDFPNGTDYQKLPDDTWYWKVRTMDGDGDWSEYSPPWMFILDGTAPTSEPVNIHNNSYHNTLNTISGFAFDPPNSIGIYKVELAIKRISDNYYWNGVYWSQSITWIVVEGTNDWYYDCTGVRWKSGEQYQIQSRAWDNATNIEVPSSGRIITYDTEDIVFSNPVPSHDYTSPTKQVEVGITITDTISLINGSSIEYTLTADNGKNWSTWTNVIDHQDAKEINIALNLIIPNGTWNFIKWRASDVAGNGPAESDRYQIKVNDWTESYIPKVKLLTPDNGLILFNKSLDLTWMLANGNVGNVSYDVYFDTITPPRVLLKANFLDTKIKVTNLLDGHKYYWTVIPTFGINTGSCVSGVWSFEVGFYTPRVRLLSPTNNSALKSPKTSFLWAVDYDGANVVTYYFYLDTFRNPINYEECFGTQFMSTQILEIGKTYYWKVVPWVSGMRGQESKTWSFTIDKNYYHSLFNFTLILEPGEVTLAPGGLTYIKAKVTNFGEISDLISLRLGDSPAIINATISHPSTLEIYPKGSANFNIVLKIEENTEKVELVLNVFAISKKAEKYDFLVQEQAELTIKVSGIEKNDSNWFSFIFTFFGILLFIILSIIILSVAIYIRKRKKRSDQVEQTSPSAPTDVTPTTTPTPRMTPTLADTSNTPVTPTIVTPPTQPTTSYTSIPTLASSSPTITQQPVPIDMDNNKQQPVVTVTSTPTPTIASSGPHDWIIPAQVPPATPQPQLTSPPPAPWPQLAPITQEPTATVIQKNPIIQHDPEQNS